jgi:hypothetical protein
MAANRLGNVEPLLNERREDLRDKFAVAALTALLSHTPAYVAFASQTDQRSEDKMHDKLAGDAYRWADAMMKARDQVV